MPENSLLGRNVASKKDSEDILNIGLAGRTVAPCVGANREGLRDINGTVRKKLLKEGSPRARCARCVRDDASLSHPENRAVLSAQKGDCPGVDTKLNALLSGVAVPDQPFQFVTISRRDRDPFDLAHRRRFARPRQSANQLSQTEH